MSGFRAALKVWDPEDVELLRRVKKDPKTVPDDNTCRSRVPRPGKTQ
jgi:hypothetical protein